MDQLFRLDENAMWSYGTPQMYGDTMMITCTVEAFGRARTAQLPVMDNRHKAIANPNAFDVNTAMQRCLAKAIALHGLGLYIYAGEDLPPKETEPAKAPAPQAAPQDFAGKKPIPMPKQESGSGQNSEKSSSIGAAPITNSVTISNSPANTDPAKGTIIVPDIVEKAGEAAVVDFIAEFVGEFVPGIMALDELRSFWKINKAELERVKRFSQPKYDQLEVIFKQRAVELSK